MTSRIEYLQPEGLAEPLGLYSNVTRDTGTGLVFVAGQVALGSGGDFVGAGDFEAQLRQTFKNIGIALEGAGASYSTILKLNTYLVRVEDLPTFSSVRAKLYADAYPDGKYPPHMLAIVADLTSPDHLIEMEAIAAVAS